MPFGAQGFDWNFLLEHVTDPDEQVILVVGRELLWLPDADGRISLEQRLAADLLAVDPSGLSEREGLHDAVLRCLEVLGPQQRPRSYAKLKLLAKDPNLPVPQGRWFP
jgi:hypothetical protein